jgi:hypothetical protein
LTNFSTEPSSGRES